MATTAQILANQTNAHLSTGPRTETGKQASAQNSTRHGLGASPSTLMRAEQENYTALIDELNESYRPSDAMANTLVAELALATIRLRRCHHLEAQVLNEAEDLLSAFPTLDKIDRYRRSAERTLHRCRKELDNKPLAWPSGIPTRVVLPSTPARLQQELAASQGDPLPTPTNKQNEANLAVAVPTNKQNEPNPVTPYRRPTPKVGRNEPCPCGSNRKYKQCCLNRPSGAPNGAKMSQKAALAGC